MMQLDLWYMLHMHFLGLELQFRLLCRSELNGFWFEFWVLIPFYLVCNLHQIMIVEMRFGWILWAESRTGYCHCPTQTAVNDFCHLSVLKLVFEEDSLIMKMNKIWEQLAWSRQSMQYLDYVSSLLVHLQNRSTHKHF